MRFSLEDLEGTFLVVDNEQRHGHICLCVGYELAGDRIASSWCHLTREQAAGGWSMRSRTRTRSRGHLPWASGPVLASNRDSH
jgi:hypothetical protein